MAQLAAVEDAATNSSTITYDFEAAGISADNFTLEYDKTCGSNVECGKVEIFYTK